MAKKRKLLKIGRTDVKSALGFFTRDGYKIYVASSQDDVDQFVRHGGYAPEDLRPMSEIEATFRRSSALKFISWCRFGKMGCIVPQGARQVTFDYDTQKVVLRIR